MSLATVHERPDPAHGERYALDHPERAAVVGGAFLALAIVGAVAVGSHPEAFRVDRAWADHVTAVRGAAMTSIAERVFDPLGRFPLSWLIVAIAGLMLWRARRRRAIAVLVIGELAAWAASSLIKLAVDRPRPPGALVASSLSSFPSGHVSFAAVTAVLLVGLFVPTGRRTGPAVLAAALTLAMAWSRTYLFAHWLTDVVGGLCVGAGIGALTLAAMGSAADRTDRRRPSERSRLG
jgi:undecaprenyl-diphosphatase